MQRERNNLSSLIQDEYAARAALALLVADSVQDFNVSATTLDDVLVPDIQPGLPSSLLYRRPDIVQAEANLKLSRADVDLARLAYLPNISLTGSVRLASDSLGDLLGDGTTTVSASAGFANQEQLLEMLDAMAMAIAGLAVVIGGIGMTNALFMSVFERTREIGVLRSLGWRRRQVLGLILGEAILLALLGAEK